MTSVKRHRLTASDVDFASSCACRVIRSHKSHDNQALKATVQARARVYDTYRRRHIALDVNESLLLSQAIS